MVIVVGNVVGVVDFVVVMLVALTVVVEESTIRFSQSLILEMLLIIFPFSMTNSIRGRKWKVYHFHPECK